MIGHLPAPDDFPMQISATFKISFLSTLTDFLDLYESWRFLRITHTAASANEGLLHILCLRFL